MQESFHSYHFFPNFLIHVIVFCNDVCAPFKLTFVDPKHALTSLMAYHVAFDMACPK